MKVWRMGDGEVRVERCWTDSEKKSRDSGVSDEGIGKTRTR